MDNVVLNIEFIELQSFLVDKLTRLQVKKIFLLDFLIT